MKGYFFVAVFSTLEREKLADQIHFSFLIRTRKRQTVCYFERMSRYKGIFYKDRKISQWSIFSQRVSVFSKQETG